MERIALLAFCLLLLLSACGPARSPGTDTRARSSSDNTGQAAPKRVTVAVSAEPPVLYRSLSPSTVGAQAASMQELLSAGLTYFDSQGRLLPQLAEAVPSVENGLWKVFPDGRMETTWTIRAGSEWQDGTPFTTADLLFTASVWRDSDLPEFRAPDLDAIEDVEALDQRTIRVRWKRTYIDADKLFGLALAEPLQRQPLEHAYTQQKATFTEHPYFITEFVGLGPYRIQEWVKGSHMMLRAYDKYALGRPKIDEIEMKFIPDGNTVVANVLAGGVDVTLGRIVSLEQAVQVADRWTAGKLELSYLNWYVLWPQLIDARPPVITDVRFRRALLHALDRQQMVDALMLGRSDVSHSLVHPTQIEYQQVARSITSYAYDPRIAVRMIEDLGYAKGTDGTYRDGAGERIALEVWATAGDANQKLMFAIADYWKQIGVGTEAVAVPPQRAQDREYRASFPGFSVQRQPSISGLAGLHSRHAPVAENRFTGNNRSRYMNPEFDALIDRFFATIPYQDRMDVLAQIVGHMSSQLNAMPLVYHTEPNLIANRLSNVGPRGDGGTQTWNVHEWDIR